MKLMIPPRKKLEIRAGTGFSIRGEAQCFVVDGKSRKVVKTFPKQKNLILNRFMEGVPTKLLADMFKFAVASTGVTATADDSGTTTVAQSGTSVTLTGGSFTLTDTATDAGKIIKWDTGEEARIVTVASGTSATVTPSQTVSGGQFTVYRTNQSQMASTGNEERAGNGIAGTAYLAGAGNCETLYTPSPQVTMTRTYDFAIRADGNRGASGTPYNELGFSELTTVGGANLNSRILLAVAVPVESGQQLRVKYSLIITLSPTTLETVSSSPITGWSTATGKQQIQRPMLALVANSGATSHYFPAVTSSPLDPSSLSGVLVSISTSSASPNAYNSNGPDRTFTDPAGVNNHTVAATKSTPDPTYAASSSANALFLDKIGTFGSTIGNGTAWRSLCVCATDNTTGGLIAANQMFVYVLDSAQVKDSIHSLTLNFRFTWSRVLG